MIRWCAYCQTYLGEFEPLDEYGLSHGICGDCGAQGVIRHPDLVARIRPLAAFFDRVRQSSRAGWERPAAQVLAEAQALGIRPLELLTGIMQPALEEIGSLWRAGQVSVAMEHQFTRMVSTVMELISLQVDEPPAPPPGRGTEFLLLNAEGNFHTLGVRTVELWLRARGRSALAVEPGLPVHEGVALVRDLRPRVVGISLSMAEQGEGALALAETLQELGASAPRVVVGGAALRGKALPAAFGSVPVIRDPHGLLEV